MFRKKAKMPVSHSDHKTHAMTHEKCENFGYSPHVTLFSLNFIYNNTCPPPPPSKRPSRLTLGMYRGCNVLFNFVTTIYSFSFIYSSPQTLNLFSRSYPQQLYSSCNSYRTKSYRQGNYISELQVTIINL